MTDYVPTNYQKKAFRTIEIDEDGEFYLERTSQPFPKKYIYKAFQYSIAKWTVSCELLEQGVDLIDCGESATCALCQIVSPGCSKCPISTYVDMIGCTGTPYTDWGGNIEERLEVARNELAFLQKVYRWWMCEVNDA